jgi:hypothetical protein
MSRRAAWLRTLLAACALFALPVHADEGMWTFDNLPLARLQKTYGFTPDASWLEHVQRSCVNFGGGSGAFVSADGLVLTNHHVALGQLQKLSSAAHDYQHEGFFARTPAEELPCPDLELKVLWQTENVTAAVNEAMAKATTPQQRNVLRKEALAKLEAASVKRTGLKVETVELYQGGEYWLYGYRTFKDVRLVCAPEEQIAFFGGDPDNFGFPRYNLDMAFFRVYENGKPFHPEHHLAWNTAGPREDDLVFVAGHPGRTNRRRTVAQYEVERDVERPLRIALQERRVETLLRYAKRGAEEARQASGPLRGLENNLKRERGFLELLRDGEYLGDKRAAEQSLRTRLAADPALAARYGDAWDRIAAAQGKLRERARVRQLHDTNRLSRFLDLGTGLVRMAHELEKPNEKRFREYRDANLASVRFQMMSPAPIYPALEEAMLLDRFTMLADSLGPSDAWLQAALGGQTPAALAHAIATESRLGDVAVRQQLMEGGRAALEASNDPAIRFALRIDRVYREERRWFEDQVESIEAIEGARIAKAVFELDGRDRYPDATGTLRLSYGRTSGYAQVGTVVPWQTTFYGLYDRARSFNLREPFNLPKRWLDAESTFPLATPFNFVCSADIIGGNSGSPVIDREGRYVGLVFDGNIQSFAWEFGYTDRQARCVSVDSRAILESLRRVYKMDALADELTRKP